MGVIICLVAAVVGILLFDYITAINWQQVTSDTRNSIVFEKRNKAYGAYTLRKNYDKIMIIIMLSVALSIGATVGIYNYVSNLPEPKVEEEEVELVPLTMDPAKPEEELPPPPPETPPPPTETTVAFNPPVFMDEEVLEDIQIVSEDDKASDETKKGTDDPFAIVEQGPTETIVEDKKEEKVEEALEFVEEEATFSGGSIQKWISDNVVYPDISRELGEQGKVHVEFVVEKDGSITGVRIAKGVSDDLDKEALRLVRKMPRWNPAKNNGKVVRSRCRLPINFTLGG